MKRALFLAGAILILLAVVSGRSTVSAIPMAQPPTQKVPTFPAVPSGPENENWSPLCGVGQPRITGIYDHEWTTSGNRTERVLWFDL